MSHSIFFINWVLFDIIIVFCIHNILKYENKEPYVRFSSFKFIWIYVILGTFGFISSDYYGYLKAIKRLSLYHTTLDLEPVYWVIGYIVDYNILIFRFIIIAISAFLINKIVHIVSINKSIYYYIFFITTFYFGISIMRSFLADSIMFVGMIYFYKYKNIKSLLYVICLMTIGWFFHKSSFMVIIVFILSLLPLKKIILECAIVSIPLLIIFVQFVVPLIFNTLFEDSTYNVSIDTNSFIGIIKEKVGLFSIIVFNSYLLFKMFNKVKSNDIMYCLYRYLFWSVYIYVIMLFSPASKFVGERLYFHALIPQFILYAYSVVSFKGTTRRSISYILIAQSIITQIGILVVWAYHQPELSNNTYIN